MRGDDNVRKLKRFTKKIKNDKSEYGNFKQGQK